MPFISIDNIRCFYREEQPEGKDAPVILCIHGSGGDSSVWEKQGHGLGKFFRLLIPDMPGHGSTGGHACTSVADYSRWVHGFSGALGLSRFFLMGHSLGGMVAQEYARLNSDRVAGLVLVSTAGSIALAPDYMQVLKNDFQRAVRMSCDNAYAPGVAQDLYRRGYDMVLRNGQEAYCNDLLACQGFDSSSWVGALALPALVICGRHDTITLPSCSRFLHEAIRGSELQV
ncbi:MAG: alpha/beta hydrolase, partial [Pseudomonadota bacterium]